MVQKLKKYEGLGRRKGRDFTQYLDGEIYRMTLEESGLATLNSLASSLRYHAKKAGLGLRTKIEDGKAIVFQTFDEKEWDK